MKIPILITIILILGIAIAGAGLTLTAKEIIVNDKATLNKYGWNETQLTYSKLTCDATNCSYSITKNKISWLRSFSYNRGDDIDVLQNKDIQNFLNNKAVELVNNEKKSDEEGKIIIK